VEVFHKVAADKTRAAGDENLHKKRKSQTKR
jgi:hypothetical protein